MRSTRFLSIFFILFLAGCSAKSLKNHSSTLVTANIEKDCVIYLTSNDVIQYEFLGPGTQSVKKGKYLVTGQCPTAKIHFPDYSIDSSSVEFTFGPGVSFDTLEQKLIVPANNK